MTTYGLTPQGFIQKTLDVIKSENEDAIRGIFGDNTNLGPESNFGQLVGIQSEREALIWELALAVYSSQYPAGASGTSVDNILALNNMRRLKASGTKTNPNPITLSSGIRKYGLLVRGTPGTVVTQGSLVQTNQSPPFQFQIDADVTIQAALNAVQSIYFSNTPDTGAFVLSIVNEGDTLATVSVPYTVQANATNLAFASVPLSGGFKLKLTVAGVDVETASIPFTANAAAVQSAINALTGFSGVTVTGSFAASFNISWGAIPAPLTTVTSNTTTVATTIIDSLQSVINALYNSSTTLYPFTDVSVSGSFAGFVLTFGANTPATDQPSSEETPQPLTLVDSNTLMMGSNVTNMKVATIVQGAPAQGIASATSLLDGPNFIAAGTINVIGTSISGWDSVINELDCISGTNVETDTQALTRRQDNLDAQANGPLQSIVAKVRALTDVTACIGFENIYEAALQVVSFPVQPSSGSYKLIVGGFPTSLIAYNATAAQIQTAIRAIPVYDQTLVSGDSIAGFTIDFNGAQGGQPQVLMGVGNNTTGGAIVVSFGRPGKAFEIVVEGGDDLDIAKAIFGSKPAGIQTYGSSVQQVFDEEGNAFNIYFSRPQQVPFYVVITMVTDLLTASSPKFNPATVATIQQDIADIGNAVPIGGLVIGFGSNGLIGAFNNVPGIISYTMSFGRTINPVTNSNVQMQPEEVPNFESFNIAISYT